MTTTTVRSNWTVWCRDDTARDGTPGEYIRATSHVFTGRAEALAYAATCAKGREAVVRRLNWQDKALAATRDTKFGAILRCALRTTDPYVSADDADLDPETAAQYRRDRMLSDGPSFHGKASVTLDGFVVCDFVDRDGVYHYGAFVGSIDDLDRNLVGLGEHLKLDLNDRDRLTAAVANWIGNDWRKGVRS